MATAWLTTDEMTAWRTYIETYSDLIAAAWLPIAVATIISTFVVMAVTGVLAQKLENRQQRDVD